MLYPLIDGKDRDVPGMGEAPLMDDPAEVLEDRGGPVGEPVDAVDIIGTGEVERLFRYPFAYMFEKRAGVGAQVFFYFIDSHGIS
jgi:hypothetical protein